jgi:hypothetical protein
MARKKTATWHARGLLTSHVAGLLPTACIRLRDQNKVRSSLYQAVGVGVSQAVHVGAFWTPDWLPCVAEKAKRLFTLSVTGVLVCLIAWYVDWGSAEGSSS